MHKRRKNYRLTGQSLLYNYGGSREKKATQYVNDARLNFNVVFDYAVLVLSLVVWSAVREGTGGAYSGAMISNAVSHKEFLKKTELVTELNTIPATKKINGLTSLPAMIA